MASLYRSSSGGDVMPAPASEDAGGRDGPPAQLHFADDVLLGHHPPVAAVRAVVPMVAHHEVIAFGNDLWSPVVVAAVLGRDVVVVQRHVVHVHAPVHDAHRVALFGDDALHERLVRI